MKGNKEKDFQNHIINALKDGGYKYIKESEKENGLVHSYDRDFAVDRADIELFVKTTQKKTWKRLKDKYADPVDVIVKTANAEMLKKNKVSVLKHGIDISGVHVCLMYAKPVSNMNSVIMDKYKCNIFSVMDEVWVSSSERVDLVLFLNGFSLFTFELKYTVSGQSYRHAVNQYKQDRSKNTKIFDSKTGAVVHFAMDENEVYMTTYIDGRNTVFLPFNQGCGTGIDAGAGNPPCMTDFPVHYMYDYILLKDNVLDLISNFVYFDKKKKKNIFPRYHQFDCITKLIEAVKKNVTKEDYLIQHSAGSGKTNEIAWLTYRLASLHITAEDEDKKFTVFDKVIVITDRVTIDRQLQAAIMEMEHCSGFVTAIGKGCTSADLKDALCSNTKIIITTIQKFPYIADEIKGMKDKRFAVVIDEAHSSTSGDDMAAVKKALSIDADAQDIIAAETQRTGRQPNVAMFAFTATPKAKTIQMFGTAKENGKKEAFHTYSMKQAVEEGYIVDVFGHYVEYTTYYRLNKTIDNDPTLNKMAAKKAIAKAISLNPENINQKLEIIVDNFIEKVMRQLNGNGKAMVLCASREEAVEVKKAIDKKLLKKNGATKALVAFSGMVKIDGVEYTETGMNGFSENKTAAAFDTNEYGIMVVADKYQTGFDQPKLCGMYIMKPLKEVNAVQTLSRLNRPCPPYEKEPVIIDFVNSCEDIRSAFKPFYTTTVLSEDITAEDLKKADEDITTAGILISEEVDKACQLILKDNKTNADAAYIAYALNEVSRKLDKLGDSKKVIESSIRCFVRAYSFLSLATEMDNEDLYKKYIFLKEYKKVIDSRSVDSDKLDEIINAIKASDFSQKKEKETKKEILSGGEEVTADGFGAVKDTVNKEALLSDIIDEINSKMGLKLDGDILVPYIKEIKERAAASEELSKYAGSNGEGDFSSPFYRLIKKILIDEIMVLNGIGGEKNRTASMTEKEKSERKVFATEMVKNSEEIRTVFGMFLDEVYRGLKSM